jgi:hypothetical protein
MNDPLLVSVLDGVADGDEKGQARALTERLLRWQ